MPYLKVTGTVKDGFEKKVNLENIAAIITINSRVAVAINFVKRSIESKVCIDDSAQPTDEANRVLGEFEKYNKYLQITQTVDEFYTTPE